MWKVEEWELVSQFINVEGLDNLTSKTQLDRRMLALFINYILGYFAVMGVELDEPGIVRNHELTLTEYLKLKNNGKLS